MFDIGLPIEDTAAALWESARARLMPNNTAGSKEPGALPPFCGPRGRRLRFWPIIPRPRGA